MSEYYPKNARTNDIHRQIITICEYLKTGYESKKHGGYNIYLDDKIHASTDTYVANVDLEIILPHSKNELVFSCSYTGDCITYHTGKWEEYLEKLYEKAIKIKEERDIGFQQKREEEIKKAKSPASKMADEIFN